MGKKHFNKTVYFFAFLVIVPASLCLAGTSSLSTYQRDTRNQAGIEKSDLMMRILSNTSGSVPKEEALKQWRADRLEWTYANSPSLLKMLHESGGTYAGAIASGTQEANYALVAFGGQPATAHGRYRGCMNNPGFTFAQYTTAMKWADLGTDSVQHDEALTNFTSFHYGWATCFCEFCTKDFAKYCRDEGVSYPAGVTTWDGFDYGRYLKEAKGIKTNSEYESKRESLPLAREFERYQAYAGRKYKTGLLDLWKAKTGKPLTLSMNMVPEMAGTFGFSRCPILDYLDYIIGEYYVDKKTAAEWVHCCRLADAMNLEFVASIKKVAKTPTVEETRQAIALSYALGHHVLMPWDIYIHDAPRWYGDIKDYEDMVAFIDENPGLFDGYRSYSDVMILVPFVKEEYEPGLLALSEALQKRGVLFSYSVCGTDRNEFVHVPIYAKDFEAHRPVWIAGKKGDFADRDWKRFEEAIHRGTASYRGEILPALFANQQKAKTQVQAMHDLDLNESDEEKEPEQPEVSLEAIADTAAEKMLKAGLKPSYRVAGSKDILVLPRVQEGGVAVHLVNTGAEVIGETTVWLSEDLFGTMKPAGAKLHRPGSAAVSLKVRSSRGGVTVSVPDIKEWAIVTFGDR